MQRACIASFSEGRRHTDLTFARSPNSIIGQSTSGNNLLSSLDNRHVVSKELRFLYATGNDQNLAMSVPIPRRSTGILESTYTSRPQTAEIDLHGLKKSFEAFSRRITFLKTPKHVIEEKGSLCGRVTRTLSGLRLVNSRERAKAMYAKIRLLSSWLTMLTRRRLESMKVKAEKLVAEGVVVHEILEDKLKKKRAKETREKKSVGSTSTTYYLEGNTEYYSDDNLRKRLQLRSHERVKNAIDIWWDIAVATETFLNKERGSCSLPVDSGGRPTIGFDAYRRMNLCLYKALIPVFDLPEAEKSVLDDWVGDSHGMDRLTYGMFFESIFELVDVWTDAISVDAYVAWLDRVAKNVTVDIEASIDGEESPRSPKPRTTPERSDEGHEGPTERVKRVTKIIGSLKRKQRVFADALRSDIRCVLESDFDKESGAASDLKTVLETQEKRRRRVAPRHFPRYVVKDNRDPLGFFADTELTRLRRAACKEKQVSMPGKTHHNHTQSQLHPRQVVLNGDFNHSDDHGTARAHGNETKPKPSGQTDPGATATLAHAFSLREYGAIGTDPVRARVSQKDPPSSYFPAFTGGSVESGNAAYAGSHDICPGDALRIGESCLASLLHQTDVLAEWIGSRQKDPVPPNELASAEITKISRGQKLGGGFCIQHNICDVLGISPRSVVERVSAVSRNKVPSGKIGVANPVPHPPPHLPQQHLQQADVAAAKDHSWPPQAFYQEPGIQFSTQSDILSKGQYDSTRPDTKNFCARSHVFVSKHGHPPAPRYPVIPSGQTGFGQHRRLHGTQTETNIHSLGLAMDVRAQKPLSLLCLPDPSGASVGIGPCEKVTGIEHAEDKVLGEPGFALQSGSIDLISCAKKNDLDDGVREAIPPAYEAADTANNLPDIDIAFIPQEVESVAKPQDMKNVCTYVDSKLYPSGKALNSNEKPLLSDEKIPDSVVVKGPSVKNCQKLSNAKEHISSESAGIIGHLEGWMDESEHSPLDFEFIVSPQAKNESERLPSVQNDSAAVLQKNRQDGNMRYNRRKIKRLPSTAVPGAPKCGGCIGDNHAGSPRKKTHFRFSSARGVAFEPFGGSMGCSLLSGSASSRPVQALSVDSTEGRVRCRTLKNKSEVVDTLVVGCVLTATKGRFRTASPSKASERRATRRPAPRNGRPARIPRSRLFLSPNVPGANDDDLPSIGDMSLVRTHPRDAVIMNECATGVPTEDNKLSGSQLPSVENDQGTSSQCMELSKPVDGDRIYQNELPKNTSVSDKRTCTDPSSLLESSVHSVPNSSKNNESDSHHTTLENSNIAKTQLQDPELSSVTNTPLLAEDRNTNSSLEDTNSCSMEPTEHDCGYVPMITSDVDANGVQTSAIAPNSNPNELHYTSSPWRGRSLSDSTCGVYPSPSFECSNIQAPNGSQNTQNDEGSASPIPASAFIKEDQILSSKVIDVATKPMARICKKKESCAESPKSPDPRLHAERSSVVKRPVIPVLPITPDDRHLHHPLRPRPVDFHRFSIRREVETTRGPRSQPDRRGSSTLKSRISHQKSRSARQWRDEVTAPMWDEVDGLFLGKSGGEVKTVVCNCGCGIYFRV
eukprot:Rmarinus@m.403